MPAILRRGIICRSRADVACILQHAPSSAPTAAHGQGQILTAKRAARVQPEADNRPCRLRSSAGAAAPQHRLCDGDDEQAEEAIESSFGMRACGDAAAAPLAIVTLVAPPPKPGMTDFEASIGALGESLYEATANDTSRVSLHAMVVVGHGDNIAGTKAWMTQTTRRLRQRGRWDVCWVPELMPPSQAVSSTGKGARKGRWQHSWSKLHIFSFIQFQALVYLDADTLVVQPRAFLPAIRHAALDLQRPQADGRSPRHLAAAQDAAYGSGRLVKVFNSGVMLVRPSASLYARLVSAMSRSNEGEKWQGEQDFLNAYFPFARTCKLPLRLNVHLSALAWAFQEYYEQVGKNQSAVVVHFTLFKPKPHDNKKQGSINLAGREHNTEVVCRCDRELPSYSSDLCSWMGSWGDFATKAGFENPFTDSYNHGYALHRKTYVNECHKLYARPRTALPRRGSYASEWQLALKKWNISSISIT